MDFSDWLRKVSGRKQLSGNGSDSNGSDNSSGSLYSGDSMFSIAPMQPTDTPNFANPPLNPVEVVNDDANNSVVTNDESSVDGSASLADSSAVSNDTSLDDSSSEDSEATVLDDGDEVSLDDTDADSEDTSDDSDDSAEDDSEDVSEDEPTDGSASDDTGEGSDSADQADQINTDSNPAPITVAAANQDGQGGSGSEDEDLVDSAAEQKAVEDVVTQASIASSNQQVAQVAADQVTVATDAQSAQNAADAAQTAADAAQAAADQAQTDADTAQAYADQHPDDADAQTTAINAQSVADSAQSTADTVQTVADTAEDTASNFPDDDSAGATSDSQNSALGSTNTSGNERQGQAFTTKDNKDGSTEHVYSSGETIHVAHEGTVAPTTYNNKGQAVYTNHTIGSDHYGELYIVTQDSSGNVVHEYANHDKVVIHHPSQTGGTTPPVDSSAPTAAAEQVPVATPAPPAHQEAPPVAHQVAAPVAVSGTIQPDVSAAPSAEDHAVQPTATDAVYENEDAKSKFYHHRFVVKDLGGGMQRHVYWNIGEHEDMSELGNAKLISGAPAEAPPPAPSDQPAPIVAADTAPAPEQASTPAPETPAAPDVSWAGGHDVYTNYNQASNHYKEQYWVKLDGKGGEYHNYKDDSVHVNHIVNNQAAFGGAASGDIMSAGLGFLPHASSYHHSPKISERSGAVIGSDQALQKQTGGWAAASADTPLDPGNSILATGEHIDTDPMSGNPKAAPKN
jgi:hypothetical protein